MDQNVDARCPMCGSQNVDFENDNLDDLFADPWYQDFELDFIREYTCRDCGEPFAQTWHFTIEYVGSEAI